MIDGQNPFAENLQHAIGRLYEVFAVYEVSPSLDVCFCPVCMTEETRQEIIKTPVRDMPVELIQEYSNSAHGVPLETDDLKALLPRYLDLFSQDEEVDYNSVGTELSRFGDAWRAEPGLFLDAELAALLTWARAFLLYVAYDQALGEEGCNSITHVLDVLLCGGFPETELITCIQNIAREPQYTAPMLAEFCAEIQAAVNWKHAPFLGLDFYGAGTAGVPGQEMATWLNSDAFRALLTDIASGDLDARHASAVGQMFDLSGQFDAQLFKPK